MLSLTDSTTINSSIDRSFPGFRRIQVINDALILITESPHVAAVYNVETNKSICSRYFPETEKLTSPVVYDHVSKRCVAVQQGHNLTLWTLPESREPSEDANNNLDENGLEGANGRASDSVDDLSQEQSDIKYRFKQPITTVIANRDGECLVLFAGGFVKFLSAAIESRGESTQMTIEPTDKIVTVELLSNRNDLSSINVPESYEIVLISERASCRWYHRLMIDVATHQVELKEICELPPLVVLNIHPVTGFICGINEVKEVVKINHTLAQTVHRIQPSPSANSSDGESSGARGESDLLSWLQMTRVRCITSFASCEDIIALFIDITDSEFAIVTLDLRFGFTQETAISLPPIDCSCVHIVANSMYILSTNGLSIHTFSVGPVTLASITRERYLKKITCQSDSSGGDATNASDPCDLIRLLDFLPSMKISEMLESLKQMKKKSGILIPESITAVLVNELICRQPNLKQRETEQLIEVILRTPFNTERLSAELKVKSIEPCKVLKTIGILLDRASEEDVLTAQVLDLISTLIDCNLSQILIRVDSLSQLLTQLKDKLDQISVFYTVATSLKSHLDAILCKNFKFEPSISLKVDQPIPPFSVVEIHF